MKLETGNIISERYQIEYQLGSGGMAIVYRALDLKLDRSVTLKVMRDTLDEGFAERFYKEAQSVASLSHANIVKVYDYGEDDGVRYIVMEYVDGTTLKDLIVRKAPFDEEGILGVAVQIASGLLHAHKNDVIHRDIKPQNILVTHDGSVKIADFGIARAAKATTLTSDANSMGSVHYFSPEQARGGFVDHKSDIYALGITMFEMATGQLPYEGDAAVTVALKHINDPFPDPQEINPDISDQLRHIICKATEKPSAKRYAAIEDMYRDMKRTIANVDFLEDVSFEEAHTVRISQEDMESVRQHRRDYTEQLRQVYDATNENSSEFEEDTKSDRKIIVAAFAAAAILVVLITIASIIIFFNLRARYVDPPNLVGLTIEDAEALAEEYGLGIVIANWDVSEEHDEGYVMYQPDSAVRLGDAVFVTASVGSAYVTIPNVLNLERSDAIDILSALHLRIYEVDYADPDIVTGIVVQTSPPPDATILRDDGEITLYISLGPDNSPFPMPNLRAMPEEGIVDFIQEEHGLIVRELTHQASAMFPAGTVLSQSIEPGEPVLPGSFIDIVISTGSVVPSPTPTPPPDDDVETNGASITGTPEPSPMPSPSPSPTPPVEQTRVLSIDLTWDVPEGADNVHLIVLEVVNGTTTPIVSYPVPVSDFPIPIPVSGSGFVRYLIISREADGLEVNRATAEIDFSVPG